MALLLSAGWASYVAAGIWECGAREHPSWSAVFQYALTQLTCCASSIRAEALLGMRVVRVVEA